MPAPKQPKQPARNNVSDPVVDISDVDAQRLAEAIAVYVMDTIKHYWLSPSDAQSALDECFTIFSGIAASCPQVSFRSVGGVLSVNGKPIEDASQPVRMLVEHFADVGIDNFIIADNVPAEEFARFLNLVALPAESLKSPDGLKGILDQNGITHITAKKMIYKEIIEGEVTVSRKVLESRGPGGGGDSVGNDGAAPAGGGILAFLKGDISLSDGTISEVAREAASDPEKMAEFILRAASIQASTANVDGGELLGDFVVGCLRRTYEAMKQDPAYQTQKGKKKTIRDLVLLEEEIVKRMREMTDVKFQETDIEAIAEETEELTEEIKIDAVADEYVDKTMANQEAEDKLLELMRAGAGGGAGEGVLKKKLTERGITGGGWQDLVIKSGAGSGAGVGAGGGSAAIMEAISHLNTLLDNMEKEFDRTSKSVHEKNARQMLDVLHNVSGQIQQLSAETGQRIHGLIEGIQNDAKAIGMVENDMRKMGGRIALTRSQVLDTISEIVRNIMEPLDLIRTSLDMINSKVFEGNPAMKEDAFKVMTDNANLAKSLLENLRTISTQKQASPTRQ
ncbi:MAG: hypothetical protein C0404_04915 [Verrucomicrobia bacterium]|nr:hypothetical protein [Verrucomicrobiota bacterium]